MKKNYITFCITALFTIGFAASNEEQSKSPSSEPTTEKMEDDNAKRNNCKAISQIKDIEELRQAINNTVWTHTTRGDAWLRYEFNGNTVKQYGALPRSGEWRYDGESQFELSERRSDYDGKRYFVATFMPKTESLAMFELPATFNFRDYHLYLNGQDMGAFIMADYEWD